MRSSVVIFRDLFKTGMRMANDNAPALLTAFGAVGTVTTAVLVGKASFEAARKIADAEEQRSIELTGQEDSPFSLTKTEKVKLVWPLYVTAVCTGVTTCGAIVMAHRVSSRRAAALAAAYALSEGRFEEYQEKIKEKLGLTKEKEARDEIIQKHVDKDTANGTIVFSPMDGKVMIKDEYSGRYFYSNIEEVNRAVNEINAHILRHDSATLSEFYDRIGLEHVSTSDYFGWNTNERLEIDWSVAVAPDEHHAVHVFEFTNPPVMNPGSMNSFR